MKCLTIVTAMSGHGGHGLARKIAEHNPDYRWYDHPRNNKEHPAKFPELDIAENHFRKRFSSNEVFPHLFDRIDSLINNEPAYYNLASNEIKLISQEKKLVYVCHDTPDQIKKKFPDSTVIQILPTKNILDSVIDRHMRTHMVYPVQAGLHNLPGRINLLNDLYWAQDAWSKENSLKNTVINFRSFFYKKSIDQITTEERSFQKDLYIRQLETLQNADVSMIVETVEEALKRI
jgi:hypothetical protein